jgi:tetratricopeptide (TPR) repeat protein
MTALLACVAAGLAVIPQWTYQLRDSLADTDEALTLRAHDALLRGDVEAAVAGFRRAVARDPASPYRWCDLAEALMEAGATAEARQCYERAVESGPRIAAVLLRAANLSFRAGDPQRALEYDGRVLGLVRGYEGPIFLTYTRMGVPAQQIVDKGLPDDRSKQEFFLYLTRVGPVEDLELVWRALRSRGIAEDRAADRFASFLVNAKLASRAGAVWGEQVAGREPGYRSSEWVFNGGFEREAAGEVFDWRIAKIEGARAERDTSVAAAGKASLRITFDGRHNLTYSHVSQRTVTPAGNYLFRARVRAEGISTDKGVGFRIRGEGVNIATGDVRGTKEWGELAMPVRVEGTKLLEIGLVRSPSGKFDNKLRGTLWIDEVKLEKRD